MSTITLRLADIGKIFPTPDGPVLIDLCRVEGPIAQRAIVFIDVKGNVEWTIPKQQTKWGFSIDLEASQLPPPKRLFEITEFLRIEPSTLKEAFEQAKEVAMQTIVFDDERIYDLVVAWCMFTWVRGIFPKNINLYITGFPGTGKSQVLRFLKHFARYPTDYDPSSEKSYKWHVAQTLGTLMIDEGEYLTRSSTARLRKYHEADVVESRMLGLPMVGLTVIDLRVDAPIAIAATHLPADTAFLQRGFIIRMAKRAPRIKDFNLIPDLEQRTKVFAKTVLCNWFVIFMAMQKVYEELTNLDLDERVKDLILPIATILDVVEKDWRWLIEFAERSFSEANFVTPETMAFLMALERIRAEAKRVGNMYVIGFADALRIIDEVAQELHAQASKIRYLLQYVFAGCRVARCRDGICFACDARTVDNVLAKNLPFIDVELGQHATKRRTRERHGAREEREDDEDYRVEVVVNGRRVRL